MNNNYDEKLSNLYNVYKKFEEEEKNINWSLALGLNSVDGLKPSSYLENLIGQYINGNINIEDLELILERYYLKLGVLANSKEKECDIVSSRIIDLLNKDKDDFFLDYEMLLYIHKYLFNNIYDFAGNFRICNLTKKEVVLNNDTVRYANFNEIKDLLIYDFNEERNFNYRKITIDKQAKHFASFSSNIWQIHPFREGNTRTVAVFMIKYLRHLGYDVNNDIFKNNSTYFRNALALSNYSNYKKNINPDFLYLTEFYNNLLYCNNELPKIKVYK